MVNRIVSRLVNSRAKWLLALSLAGSAGLSPAKAQNTPPTRAFPPRRTNSTDFADYAGPESCRRCHPSQTRLWEGAGHALAERPVREDLDRRAFFPVHDAIHASQHSQTTIQNGQFQVVTLGFQSNVAPYRVERVIGWQPLRQFVTAGPRGRWQAHELAFDPKRDEWFDIYGQEDRRPGEWGHWTGGGMNWNSRCASCHNTRLLKNYDASADAYRTTMAGMGVGCEACHGPLKSHVVWRTAHANSTEAEPKPPLVRRSQTLEVCGACHSRREELTGDFLPGDSFFDHFSLEIPDENQRWYPDGQVKDEDYEFASFLSSRMYQSGVHCRDCHRSDSGSGNALCLRCHQGRASGFANAPAIDPLAHGHHRLDDKGGECIGCHAPVTVYMQRHARHDHGFGIPDPLLTKELAIPNACNRCHADKTTDWALQYTGKWYGSRMQRHSRERTRWIAAALRRDEAAVEPLVGLLATEREGSYWRAVAAGLLWPWADRTNVQPALARGLRDRDPLVREKSVMAFEGQIESADAPAAQAVRIALEDTHRCVRVAAAWVLKATVDLESRAGRDLEQALDYNIDQPRGRYRKAMLLVARRRPAEALAHLRKGIEFDPLSPPLRYQAAMVLDQLGRREEALEMLAEGERAVPGDARLIQARAELLARGGRVKEARAAATRALKAQPDFQPAKDLLQRLNSIR